MKRWKGVQGRTNTISVHLQSMYALCTDIGAHVKLCKKVLALNICVYANYSYTCNKRSATCSVEAEKIKKKIKFNWPHTYLYAYVHTYRCTCILLGSYVWTWQALFTMAINYETWLPLTVATNSKHKLALFAYWSFFVHLHIGNLCSFKLENVFVKIYLSIMAIINNDKIALRRHAPCANHTNKKNDTSLIKRTINNWGIIISVKNYCN